MYFPSKKGKQESVRTENDQKMPKNDLLIVNQSLVGLIKDSPNWCEWKLNPNWFIQTERNEIDGIVKRAIDFMVAHNYVPIRFKDFRCNHVIKFFRKDYYDEHIKKYHIVGSKEN